MSGKSLVLAVFGCMLPGTLVLLCGFYCLLHSWLNAFAEMLRFADRMFYEASNPTLINASLIILTRHFTGLVELVDLRVVLPHMERRCARLVMVSLLPIFWALKLIILIGNRLYTYVYKDVYELCKRRSRVVPMLVVFIISSLFHEYVITFTFRCFYPVLLLMFGGFGSRCRKE